MKSVGAYEAKTHLPRLLERAAAGETIVITRHGRDVAKLAPPDLRASDPGQVIDALRLARRGVLSEGDTIRAMIEEGRR